MTDSIEVSRHALGRFIQRALAGGYGLTTEQIEAKAIDCFQNLVPMGKAKLKASGHKVRLGDVYMWSPKYKVGVVLRKNDSNQTVAVTVLSFVYSDFLRSIGHKAKKHKRKPC